MFPDPNADVIVGGGGRDVLKGLGGDDRLCGEGGNDRLIGGEGADRLNGGAGMDTIKGQHGDNILVGGGADDTLIGGDGSDKVKGKAGDDLLKGGAGKDNLNGGSGDDQALGGPGSDRCTYSATRKGCERPKAAGWELRMDGIGPARLGDAVLPLFTKHLGDPDTDYTIDVCDERDLGWDRYHLWLALGAHDQTLFMYGYRGTPSDDPLALATPAGIRPGSTGAEVLAVYPDAYVQDSEAGTFLQVDGPTWPHGYRFGFETIDEGNINDAVVSSVGGGLYGFCI